MALTKFQKLLLPEKVWENETFKKSLQPYKWALKKWKIAVPIFIIFFVVFFIVVTLYMSQFLKSHAVFQGGYKRALKNTKIQEILGENIKEAFIITGSVESINSKIAANITANLSGSKGKGVLTIKANVKNDEWYYKELTFANETSSINLLE